MARNPNDVGFFMKFVAFIGWITLCVGVSFVILCVNEPQLRLTLRSPRRSCPVLGFGLVTYPFVIRELNAPRRNPAEQRS